MICAIGVRPEACATAYSLALRSLEKTGESAVAIAFRRSSAPSGIPPPWMRSRSTAAAWRSSSLSGTARFPNNAKAIPCWHIRGLVARVCSVRILRAVRLVAAAQVTVAPVEQLKHGCHVCRPVHGVAHPTRIRRRIGRLGVPVLDQLVVLDVQDR